VPPKRLQAATLHQHRTIPTLPLFLPQVMAPPGSPNASTSAISANLSSAIDSSFGSFDAFKSGFSGKAKSLFGSGWTWLALAGQGGNRTLVLLTTANQDNPLMGLVRAR
jgi:Fe-Mn family superoxide dismutase